jgi:hypothetical protein
MDCAAKLMLGNGRRTKPFFSTAATNVKRNEVLQSFQGIRNFEQFHRQPIYLKDAAVVE